MLELEWKECKLPTQDIFLGAGLLREQLKRQKVMILLRCSFCWTYSRILLKSTKLLNKRVMQVNLQIGQKDSYLVALVSPV